jgi:hypothetical protein
MVDSPPEEEVTGTWWAQEKPEEKFYGRLAFGNSTPTLELEGAPAEDLQRDEVAPPRTFHGEALSRTFTIHRVVLSETRWSGPRAQVSYRAQAVIEGCLIDPNRTLLRDVFVRFAGLERWIGDDVFRTNFAWDDDEADKIEYRPGPIRKVPVAGRMPGQLQISTSSSIQGGGAGSRSARIDHSSHFAFSAIDEMTFDHAMQVAFHLKQAMSMFIDSAAIKESVSVRLVDNEPYRLHSVHDETITADADVDAFAARSNLTRFSEVGLGAAATWLLLAPRYSEVASLAIEALHGRLPIQSSLIAATSAAEGLHRILMPQDRELDKTATRALRRRLITASPPEYREMVQRSITQLGEPTLRMRLRHLAESLGPAMPELVSDPEAFGRRLAWFRNRHSHLHDDEMPPLVNGDKEDAEWIAQIALTRICARIVITRLLMMCGCDALMLRGALNLSSDVNSWKSRARELMPEVVAPPPPPNWP